MNYHHLTIEERSCIRKYYVDGLSYREIARLIRTEREHGVAGDTAKLYPHVRHPHLLPAHSAKEVSAAALLLPPRDVPFTGSDRVHQMRS